MINNLRLARRFYSMVMILLLTPIYIIMHVAFFIDIPYVPVMFVFRFPAVIVLTLLYAHIMLTLRNIGLVAQLKTVPARSGRA